MRSNTSVELISWGSWTFVDRFLRKFRAVATVVIDESFTHHFCGSHNPLQSWRNSPRHSQITWPIGLGGYSSVRIQKKHGKFTVAELHNKFRTMPCRCCQEDTARSTANIYKDMQRRLGVVQRSRVRFRRAGKLVQSSYEKRGKGWGKEKRSERLKVSFFSLTSFSSVNVTIQASNQTTQVT